jgi:hypothetical protein
MMQDTSGGMDLNATMMKVRRLAMLDTSVFDEVKGDNAQTIPAAVVLVVSTFLFGLGGWLWWIFNGPDERFDNYVDSGDVFLQSFILGSIISIVLWGIAVIGITYVLLTQVFRARADVNELVRVLGFAAAPLTLGVLMFIPLLDFAIGLAAILLAYGTSVLAAQSATDAPAGKVLVSVTAGFGVWALVLSLFVGDDNVYAPGFFIFDIGTEVLKQLS